MKLKKLLYKGIEIRSRYKYPLYRQKVFQNFVPKKNKILNLKTRKLSQVNFWITESLQVKEKRIRLYY